LERCLRRVPDRGRKVLQARFTDELSYEQIGQQVGMTLEAVRKALFRLKKQVRLCVETALGGTQ
jgi:RNA polymerase sigma factor (sigma-70 family)